MLRRQMAIVIDGVDAFAPWAGGDAAAAQAVRDLLSALREAFVTPIEVEFEVVFIAASRVRP